MPSSLLSLNFQLSISRTQSQVQNIQEGRSSRESCDIQTFCKEGRLDRALIVLLRMDQHDSVPTVQAYESLLRACMKKKALAEAKQVHAQLAKHGLESYRVLGDLLVTTLVNSGSLADGLQLFKQLSQRTVYSWTAIISGYMNAGRCEDALICYQQMQEDGVQPDRYTFVSLLKACSRLGNLDEGKRVHADALRTGLESDIFVSNTLISMYGKCGSIKYAEQVFARLSHRNLASWNAMLTAYCQQKLGDKGLQTYQQMQEQGFMPNDRSFVSALQACAILVDQEKRAIAQGQNDKVKAPRLGRKLHADAASRGFDSEIFAGNAEEGLQLYVRMKQERVPLGDRTFVAALEACSSVATLEVGDNGDAKHVKKWCLDHVRSIHADVVKSGSESAVFVGTMLVDVFAKCGSLVEARSVFERMPYRNVVSWTAMIFGYAQMEDGQEALQLYFRMQQEGVVPNERTFVAALKACSGLAAFEEGHEADRILAKQQSLQQVRVIHSDIVRRGSDCQIFVGTALMDVYAKCGSILDARCVFEKLPHRDVISWNVMILGYAQMEDGEEALHLYLRMQLERVVPDAQTFVAALKACCSLARLDKGVGAHESNPIVEKVRSIHSDILKAGCESDLFMGTMLVVTYAKFGSLVNARGVFEKMPCRDVISWNAMILGYVVQEECEEALQLYASMQHEYTRPNDQTFLAALKACSSLSALDDENRIKKVGGKQLCLMQVRAIHSDIVKNGSESNVIVGTMLVDVYAKCGSLLEAMHVFEQLPLRDVVSWTTIILGCIQMEKGELALQYYEAMQQEGVVPDGQAFVAALKACSSVSALHIGKEIHAQILNTGLETADLCVASSLIDMYGKCGSMVDAQHVFHALPTRDIVTWSALIAGYACQGDSDIVFDSFEKMRAEDIQPDGITFLSLLTACSHAGLVDKGQKYFESMSRAYGIPPTVNHYACMVDLLGRAGHLDKALLMARTCKSSGVVWRALLGACQKWSNVEIGRQALEYALLVDARDDAAHVLMSNIYTTAHMLEDAKEIQAQRLMTCASKMPGQSWWTDMGGVVNAFGVGDQAHPRSQEIYSKLQDLFVKLEEGAPFQPHIDKSLHE